MGRVVPVLLQLGLWTVTVLAQSELTYYPCCHRYLNCSV